MELRGFCSGWGVEPKDFDAWFAHVKQEGYYGVEFNPAFLSNDELDSVRRNLQKNDLAIIVQLFSSWPNYHGPRPLGLRAADHLERYREQVAFAKSFNPVLINIQSGSDVWSIEENVEFFRGTLSIDKELGVEGLVCHETHRNRGFHNPYVSVEILNRLPGLKLTADFSHWTVSCERFLDQNEEDWALMERVFPHVHHIHTRIGTTQASQCSEPEDSIYAPERAFFEKCWNRVVKLRCSEDGGKGWLSFVPEYGPYPYHPLGSPRTHSEVANTEHRRLRRLLGDGGN
ncbi:hypothetical protein T439DRAFT_356614 [Meredithblackwellia eburnea MCA 4105]